MSDETSYFNSARSFENYLKDDRIFRSILLHPDVQRLKGVSFLSTIPIIKKCRNDHSRFDHLLGVSYLADLVSKKLALSKEYRNILILAAMLHDIGHSPLSHAAETFLLENRNRYHEGLTITRLRKMESQARGEFAQLLPKVIDLIRGVSKNRVLHVLFSEAISLDALDGVTRSSYSLFLPFVNPVEIIDSMYYDNGKVYFMSENLPLLDRFWECMKILYSENIYTEEVLSAEAMLTRALELTFGDNGRDDKQVHCFIQMQDKEAWNKLSENKYSYFLVRLMNKRHLFKALSNIDPAFYEAIISRYSQRPNSIRFDFKMRKDIEKRVAKAYLISPVNVISHFSFIIEFRRDLSINYNQLDLFLHREGGKDPFLTSVFASYKRSRKSGARFDIFIPYSESDRQIEMDLRGRNKKSKGGMDFH